MVFQNGPNGKLISVTNYPQVAPANSNVTRYIKAKPKFNNEKAEKRIKLPKSVCRFDG